jgi:hypothetical protein
MMMARRTYPICSWIPLTFLLLLAGGGMVGLATWADKLADLLVNLAATVVGVFLALLAERSFERSKDKASKGDRIYEWVTIIRKGAESNLGLVRQMLSIELAAPAPSSPSYRSDRILSVALEQGARDLIEVPGWLDAHRHAVFELEHLDKKLDLLLTTPLALFLSERTKAEAIARNAESALLALLDKCSTAEQSLPPRLHDS